MLRRALHTYGSAIIWIVAFASVSTVAGLYILDHQRLHLPGQDRYFVNIGFARSTALSPGFGQPVTVSGVQVGEVEDVNLTEGTAVVKVQIKPNKLPHVYRDARADLLPATPSKDMEVDLDPGSPRAGDIGDAVLPVVQTNIPVDSDEFLGALDADTRDYLTTLISAAGIGLKDRGPDLKALFRVLRPTFHQLRLINSELAGREHDVAKLVHNIEELSGAFADESPQLRDLIRASNRSFAASAANDRALGTGISLLPPTIRASRTTLKSTRALVDEVRPALRALTPATAKSPRALDKAQPVLDASIPLVRDQLRPLTRRLQPLAVHLRPSIRRLTEVTPSLTRAFAALHYFTNEIVHDAGKERGYLFWLAWLGHNTASATSTDDALGTIDRGLTLVSCDSIAQPGKGNDAVALIGALARSACPNGGNTG
jgi:phospholipid/cholesterol/gamma-HCH transport system substrate-binding protein